MTVKLVLGERLVNVFSAYAPHSGKLDEDKNSPGDEIANVNFCIGQIPLGPVPRNFLVTSLTSS